MAVDTEQKGKRKKEPSLYETIKKQALMAHDNYLFSIDEARKLLRVDRNKFVDLFIKTKKIPVTVLEEDKIMIRNLDLKLFLEQQQRVYSI